ncbi:ASC domain containing protein [Asbolus verrucosus]|uniref:ASC domain containing protein n=1 Tax=Asbolus verrucosus TaxID=1661398 RepID=A0A482VX15_ASBVE|nr:ASC domain containing protein [Asbolus verrucosus]
MSIMSPQVKINLPGTSRSKPKKEHPNFRKNVYDYFNEFSNNTSIHGLKWMCERRRSVIERLWWFILFCISLYFCVILIINTWTKWQKSRIMISFAQSPVPVWEVPFPAVTVCPEMKIRQSKYNFTYYFHEVKKLARKKPTNLTAEELETYSKSSLLCDSFLYQGGNKSEDSEIIDYLESIAPSFTDVMVFSTWTNVTYAEGCDYSFLPIFTNDGICLTFNMLDKSELLTNKFSERDYHVHKRTAEWDFDDGYSKDATENAFPKRIMLAGHDNGLTTVLKAYKKDLNYLCHPNQGFKVLLHHPAEVPRVEDQYFRVPLDQELVLRIKPDMTTTSTNLNHYDPNLRKCFFSKERNLQFFKIYTQQNCLIECIANYTLKKCGCVAYYMPRENLTKICGSGSTKCILEAHAALLRQDVESATGCNCLPSCTSIKYNAEASYSKFEWENYYKAWKLSSDEFSTFRLTRIFVYFKEMKFTATVRSELFGLADFWANCGGLLGLFTGFSFLSFVEIIYFLSVRLVCNIRHYGRHVWSGSNALIDNNVGS